MGFRKFGLFFLLLSVQLHPLLALPQTSLPNLLMTLDFKQEQNVAYKGVPKTLSMSGKLGDKQNIRAVNKGGGGGRGGGGGGRVGGGGGGGSGRARGGRVIPIYGAGGTSHPHTSHSGSNGGTLNYISLHYLILAFFASFFLT